MFVTCCFESDNLVQRSKTHFKPLVYTLLFCVCLEFIWYGKEKNMTMKEWFELCRSALSFSTKNDLRSRDPSVIQKTTIILIWLLNMAYGFTDGIHNEIWINISIWATAHLPLP